MSSSDPGARLEEILAQQGLTEETPETEAQEAESADPFGIGESPAPADPVEGAAAGASAEAGSNEEAAEPTTPLFALLRSLEQDVGIDRIDRVWVFPPRRIERGETAVVVVAAFHEPRGDRRRVYAAHYTAPADTSEPRLAVDEYGTAPAERVGRLVEDVVDRLKEHPAAPPQTFHVDGDAASWHTLLHELAERDLEERRKNPRLRP